MHNAQSRIFVRVIRFNRFLAPVESSPSNVWSVLSFAFLLFLSLPVCPSYLALAGSYFDDSRLCSWSTTEVRGGITYTFRPPDCVRLKHSRCCIQLDHVHSFPLTFYAHKQPPRSKILLRRESPVQGTPHGEKLNSSFPKRNDFLGIT